MDSNISARVATILNTKNSSVENVISLLNEGSTIPFIARYRKEKTGGLDEVQIESIKTKYEELTELEARRKFILESIDKLGKLTIVLATQINKTQDINELEDLYLPFKQKKKTRAEKARQLGLEPLAKILFEQTENNVEELAKKYITDKVLTADDALSGARDIIAEWINEDKKARTKIRELFDTKAQIFSKVIKSKEKEAIKFKDYFDISEPLWKCPSHRLLAIRRGENEGFLRVSIEPPEYLAKQILNSLFIKGNNNSSKEVSKANDDSYDRLLSKSIETEFAKLAKEKADDEAINVFTTNLRQLLLAPPLGQKRVLAIDPGFRTGCKVVVLDAQGNLQTYTVINILNTENKSNNKILNELVNKYNIEAIAIGNGTASRETEAFVKNSGINSQINVFVVSEDGASVYSASKLAREEFPDYDVTVRGAVSIGRRLMDPLSELIKIDPRSIGIGQYQHDVDQSKLKQALDNTTISCVNMVGVNVNTASKELLSYVSGLGPALAANIVEFRKENGQFKKRSDLKKVKKLGPKAYEQCAGFLRIINAKNPLDNSAVHPESYHIVEKMAADLKLELKDLIANESNISKINIKEYITEDIGLPTLQDIFDELKKPGIDPRGEVEVFSFDESINKVEDLEVGQVVPGIVTNITNFGAFVDIGVHCDGLVHISMLSNSFVKNPADVVNLTQKVMVKVMEVDIERKRISLSMKDVD